MNDQAPFDRTLTADTSESSAAPTMDSPPVLTPIETIAGPSQHRRAATVTLAAEEYVVGREIARGGMGCVLAAEDRKLGRVVAMKVMRLESAASESARARFVREATVLARLEHPNIVPIHELGWDAENRPYYTMKLVQGRTLQAILNGLRHHNPDFISHYTLDRLLTIFRKICDAMSLAHAKGVIHRDLKPDNVMVGEFGEVLVMDWGLAKIQSDATQAAEEAALKAEATPEGFAERFRQLADSQLQRSADLTLEGAVMGSPFYMSPEQAEGHAAEIDQQSDIFSLGGILYALLTLHPPVDGNTADEIMTRVKLGHISPPTAFNVTKSGDKRELPGGKAANPKRYQPLPHCPGHKVPSALSAVTMRALAADKSKRYQSVADLAADVEKYQSGFATTAEQAGLLTQLRLLVQRHKREFAVAFAAWFIITALAVWFVINLRSKERRAVSGEQKATASEVVAKSETARATEAQKDAKAAEIVAVRERETARAALAKSQLDLAEKEFERGKFIEAQKILEETPESFRDANWRFLRAHERDFTRQLSIAGRGSVFRLQFLPEGDRFAARCWSGGIGIFTPAGALIGDGFPTSGDVWATWGHGAGDRMAFVASTRDLVVQDLRTGKLVSRWTSEIDPIKHVLLSPDGQTVLAAGGNKIVAYAANTGAPLWTQPFKSVVPAFSPDGKTVAILAAKAGLTLKIQLLDTNTGAVRTTLEATADNPEKTTLQFNQPGDQLACLGGDEVILWNPRTAAKIRALHFPGEQVKMLNPAGDITASSSGSRIRLWETSTGRLLRTLNGADTRTVSLDFSPDGRMLLSSHDAGGNGVVNVWPTRLGEEIASVRAGGYQGRRVLFDRQGAGIYACSKSAAAAWNIPGGGQRWRFSAAGVNVDDLAINPADGSIILSEFGKPQLTHVSPGGALEAFGTNFRSSLRFNHYGTLLLGVVAAFDPIDAGRVLDVMEYPSGKALQTISLDHPRQPFADFCQGDAAVATAAREGGITMWDWKKGTPLRRIDPAQTGSISCLAASRDGLHLATGGPDRWIRVWDAMTGRLEYSFRAHWEGVRCVKFSPDGREILSGSEVGAVGLHDISTGEEKLALHGLTTPVTDVDLSPDGTLIAAITTDGFTKVWDRKISSEAALLPKRPKPAAVAKDADGWEDLLAKLTPPEVEKIGNGWSMKDGELFSPDKNFATLPLPGDFFRGSYQVRMKLRKLGAKDGLHVILPVGERMTGFELEGFRGEYTGLNKVNGKAGKDVPGIVQGKQVKDSEVHDLEVAVRLDGANATITTTLDNIPLYQWTGPTATLGQSRVWATTEPGALALGTLTTGWVVDEVKVKRLENGP